MITGGCCSCFAFAEENRFRSLFALSSATAISDDGPIDDKDDDENEEIRKKRTKKKN